MKLNGNILIIGDLGELKAYRVGTAIRGINGKDHKETTSLELITDLDYIQSHKKDDELVSDANGRFGNNVGEPHGSQQEQDKRTMKAISENIKSIIEKESPSSWHLAFPKETHNKLSEMLHDNIKKSLGKVIPLDLTKVSKDKLLSHFE